MSPTIMICPVLGNMLTPCHSDNPKRNYNAIMRNIYIAKYFSDQSFTVSSTAGPVKFPHDSANPGGAATKQKKLFLMLHE